jgi:hypothetical protein
MRKQLTIRPKSAEFDYLSNSQIFIGTMFHICVNLRSFSEYFNLVSNLIECFNTNSSSKFGSLYIKSQFLGYTFNDVYKICLKGWKCRIKRARFSTGFLLLKELVFVQVLLLFIKELLAFSKTFLHFSNFWLFFYLSVERGVSAKSNFLL